MSRARSSPVRKPVLFKQEPFFDVLATLVEPKGLKTSGREGWQHAYIPFQFETQHVRLLRFSQTDKVESSPESNVQVHLRFCLLGTNSEQDDRYPSDLAVKVNDRLVGLPEPITSKVTGGATERVQLPINIISSCFVSPAVINELRVTWQPVRGREYVVGLFLVKKRTVATIVSGLQRERTQHATLTTTMVKKKMKRRASGDEVAVTRLHVSLTCPLSRTRMKVPCRARSCNHLDCFDASTYLQVNERRPAWICPVCGNRAALSSLVVDQLFVDIIANVPGDCESVIFLEDGSWTTSTSQSDCENDATNSATPSSSTACTSTPPSEPSSSEPEPVGRPSKRPRMEVIDLTDCSSGDEEDCGSDVLLRRV
ncbi:hypothetical protein MTO96_015608 [Rhipicephalus appendiculatus]